MRAESGLTWTARRQILQNGNWRRDVTRVAKITKEMELIALFQNSTEVRHYMDENMSAPSLKMEQRPLQIRIENSHERSQKNEHTCYYEGPTLATLHFHWSRATPSGSASAQRAVGGIMTDELVKPRLTFYLRSRGGYWLTIRQTTSCATIPVLCAHTE